jgi:hypothetical protein
MLFSKHKPLRGKHFMRHDGFGVLVRGKLKIRPGVA